MSAVRALLVASLFGSLFGGVFITSGQCAEDPGLRVPEGFEVSLYAGDELAHDIFSMTLDAQGRVVVAGAGYVKTLHDDNGDGRADRATLFSTRPASGAHGMYFDGLDLICTGDNSVMRLRDRNGDGAADGEPEVWTALRHPEHGANGIVRGPDGCYYLICGNDAGISARQIAGEHSPVKQPRSGGVVRFSAEGKPLDVYAHGFRNPYDLDFDAAGRLLTVDSDGERDHHLPWYAPTRMFDVAQGMEHGWLLQGWTRSWNRPASFFDNVERLVEIGRGSPTGVVAYRHRQFPQRYRGGVFAACWTLGRIYYCPLEDDGASARSRLETFIETTGDVGFAPCDLAVGPAGDLFIAIGGRRTRGSVFRVRYTGSTGAEHLPQGDVLTQVLAADQPLASWSRVGWVPKAKELGAAAFIRAVGDERLPVAQRVRAIEILVELFGGLQSVPASQLDAWSRDRQPRVRARLAWALGRGAVAPEVSSSLAQLTADEDPRVQRFAWEALVTASAIAPEQELQPDWSRGLSSPVRRVRAAAIAAAKDSDASSYQAFLSRVRFAASAHRLRLAQLWINLPDGRDDMPSVFSDDQVATCLEVYAAATGQPEVRLEAIRLLQIGLGDVRTAASQAEVYSGYAAQGVEQMPSELRRRISAALAPAYPSIHCELNRELARLLGMLGADESPLPAAIAGQWSASSKLEDDLHYLIVLSRLPSARTAEVTAATAHCLLSLHKKLDAAGQFASRNWPFRVGEMFDELCRRDPALPLALVNSQELNYVEHALFLARLPKDHQPQATRRLWAATVGARAEATPGLIALVGELPADEARRLLRGQWADAANRDPIILALAKHPAPEDRQKFLEGLASPQAAVVQKSADALIALGLHCTSAEMAVALRALKQSCSIPQQPEPRKSLLRLLNFWTEENSDVDEDPDPTKVWIGWYQLFDYYYPAAAARLRASSGADATQWKARLAAVDWSAGDAARGREVFERRACHRCHQQSGHLGPELKGAVSRMSREDLFTAIVDPNLEVSPTYHTTLIATNSGQVYHGLVVYESPEGTLLQTGPDTTVRITNTETSSMRRSTQSLMPTGLLDQLSDGELSDLYAYLQTLGAK